MKFSTCYYRIASAIYKIIVRYFITDKHWHKMHNFLIHNAGGSCLILWNCRLVPYLYIFNTLPKQSAIVFFLY